MDDDLSRPGWPWFRFQMIWTHLGNPYSGFGQFMDCCVACVACVVTPHPERVYST